MSAARVELWVRLKVVDLVAQTAWMTLTEKLDFSGDLCGMAHYSWWGMEAEGKSAKDTLAEIDRVVRLDSAFTNQNKHFYRLIAGSGGGDPVSAGDLRLEKDYPFHEEGARAEGGKVFACDFLVREQRGDREEGYESRLNARLEGVSVKGMMAGEVWRILVKAESGEEAKAKVESMAVTRTRREGLLMNPHYQKYEFLDVREVPAGKENRA